MKKKDDVQIYGCLIDIKTVRRYKDKIERKNYLETVTDFPINCSHFIKQYIK